MICKEGRNIVCSKWNIEEIPLKKKKKIIYIYIYYNTDSMNTFVLFIITILQSTYSGTKKYHITRLYSAACSAFNLAAQQENNCLCVILTLSAMGGFRTHI